MEKLPTFNNFINEERNPSITLIAEIFIKDVLKLGTKDNLFDAYLRKKGIDKNELSDLVGAVSDQLKSNWI